MFSERFACSSSILFCQPLGIEIGSLIIYVSTHLHCAYSGSSFLDLHHHMDRFCVTLASHRACGPTVLYEVQMGNRVQQQRIESVFPGPEPETVHFSTYNDAERRDTVRIVLECESFITGLLEAVQTGIPGKSSKCLTTKFWTTK